MTGVHKITEDEGLALLNLMREYFPESEYHYVDPDEPAEWALIQMARDPSRGSFDDLMAQLHRELDAYGHDDALLRTRLPLRVYLPTAGTARAFWEYLLHWLPQAWEHPVMDPKVDGDYPLPRASRFTDEQTANRAVTEVLRAHEQRLRDWAGDPAAPRRLHLYADLGREVGVVVARDADGRASAPEPVRAAAVTMSRLPDSGEVVVAAAYPEIALPTRARETFPDLPDLFGAYFGQDFAELDSHRWRCEWRFNTRATPLIRDRVARQLQQLLAQDDAALRADVEALGSYTLPVQLRRWVTGLLRRLTVPDWTLPPGFQDPVAH